MVGSTGEAGSDSLTPNWVALREDDGRAYLLNRVAGEVKVKGLGRFDVGQLLDGYSVGERIMVGQKSLTIVDAALPEVRECVGHGRRVLTELMVATRCDGLGGASHSTAKPPGIPL